MRNFLRKWFPLTRSNVGLLVRAEYGTSRLGRLSFSYRVIHDGCTCKQAAQELRAFPGTRRVRSVSRARAYTEGMQVKQYRNVRIKVRYE